MRESSLRPPSTQTRRHDLDALRAAAMLLGIVLHAALSFAPGDWVVQDIQQHEAFHLIFYLIHGFRMPVFFMMSGYFTVLLWRRRGLWALMQNRFQRIFVPLVLGLLVIASALVFQKQSAPILGQPETGERALLMEMPVFHLWFLWYLSLMMAGFVIAAPVIDRLHPPNLPEWLALSPARYLWLVPLTMIPTAYMNDFGADKTFGLLPVPHVIGYYAIFFVYGALYYGYKDPDGRVSQFWWLALPMGLVVVLPLGVSLLPDDGPASLLAVFLNALYPWLLISGLMGLFRKFFASEHKTVRYVADSSYWLYLAHLPLVYAAQLAVREWHLPASFKFGLICVVVTVVLLLTYRIFVRYTWLGSLLNGPRQRSAPVEGSRMQTHFTDRTKGRVVDSRSKTEK